MALSRTKWYLINIKARTNQTPLHYYNALQKLKEEDPLVFVSEDKALSLMGIGESYNLILIWKITQNRSVNNVPML